MAGRGKGVLRVAIEDFFETTPIGKWWSTWFEEFSDRIETKYIEPYRELFADIYRATKLPVFGEIARVTTPPSGRLAWLPMILGAVISLGAGAVIGYLAPWSKLGEYVSSRAAKQARLQTGDVIEAMRRGLPDLDEWLDDLRDQGWTDDRIQVLNQLRRRLLAVNEIVILWLRGDVSDTEFVTTLQMHGYTQPDIDHIKELSKVIPPVNDLITMAVREAWDDDVVRRFRYDAGYPTQAAVEAAKQGLSDKWFRKYWYAHWQLPSPQMAYEMLHRLRPGTTNIPFELDDMRTLLRTADYPEFFRDRLIAISYAPYTRVDVRRMYKLGILSYDQVVEAYKDLGYDDEHATNLAEFTTRYETGDEDTKTEKYKNLSLGLLKQAYIQGMIDRSSVENSVQRMGYPPEEVETILRLWDFERQIRNTPEVRTEIKTNTRKVTETAYSLGLIDRATAMNYLQTVGWSAEDAESLLNLIDYTNELDLTNEQLTYIEKLFEQRVINEQDVIVELNKIGVPTRYQQHLLTRWYMRREVKQRNLTEAQYRAAWRQGVINEMEYVDNLHGLGYTDYDIDLLVKLYRPA